MSTNTATKICDHCGYTVLLPSGSCPVCSQQVLYAIEGRPPFPLTIIRGSRFRIRSQRGRSAGPRGKFTTCAVVEQTDREYLTACGDVVRVGCSIWSKPPSCVKCKRQLERAVQ